MKIVLLLALLCALFAQGFVSERLFGVGAYHESPLTRVSVELLLAGNLLWMAASRPVRMPLGALLFGAYCLWALFGAYVTGASLADAARCCRYTAYAGCVYVLGRSTGLSERAWQWLLRTVAVLFLLQIAVSCVHVAILRQRFEWRVGTMSTAGGELATLFPLIALAFCMGLYLYKLRSVWVLLLGLSFGLVGYASGKRAIYFLMPAATALYLALYVQLERKRDWLPVLRTAALHLALLSVIAIPAAVVGISRSEGIRRPGGKAGAWETLRHAVVFALHYETGVWRSGGISGRTAASQQVLASLAADPSRLAFGWGPSVLARAAPEQGRSGDGFLPLGIVYGIVGWSRDAIGLGLPTVALWLLAYTVPIRDCYRLLRRAGIPATERAVAFGTLGALVVVSVTYLTYTPVAQFSAQATFLPLLLAGLMGSAGSRGNSARQEAGSSLIHVSGRESAATGLS